MDSGQRDDQLETSIRGIMGHAVPGLSIYVIKPDGVRWAKAFGLADIAKRLPASGSTVYMWFSMTKLVTATCILQLSESGGLGLDDPVVSHYPPFQQLRPSRWMESATVRHLLNHTSGLANPIPIAWIHQPDHPAPDPDTFLRDLLAKHTKLRSEPGTTARYSNLNYLILGQVIASAAGQPYQDYVRDRVLAPLGMSRTGFVFSDEMSRVAATPYQRRWSWTTALFRLALPRWVLAGRADGFFALSRFYLNGAAYGGLIGSAEDAAVFLRAHLNGGEVDGRRILSPQSAALMQTETAHGPRLRVGLGWLRRTDQRNSNEFLEHPGGGGGFFNVMRIYPRWSVGVLIMGNATSYDHRAILDLLADRWRREDSPTS